MGAAKGQEATRQVEMVCLDLLVPEDDLYRRIDALVDWGFVRVAAAAYYSDAVGRPSVDPIVLLKLMLTGALEGIASMRELLRLAGRDLSLRRFLGYGLGERLPAHQTVSEAHSRRFLDARVFEQAFQRTVALCAEHGLLDGSHLSVDGFHAEADAALASLRASLSGVPSPEPDGQESSREEPEPPNEPQLGLVEPRSGPTPKRRSSNATSVSRTDPDARLRGKPGQRPHLVHRGQVGVDPRARCVVACLGESAGGYEGDGLAPILDRARFSCPELVSVGADQGYAAERVYKDTRRRGLAAYIPPQRTMLPPGTEPRTEAEREAQAARLRCKTAAGITAHKRRMADAEGVISELKLRHGLGRARCRGTGLFHVQLLLGCAAINLKRLAKHVPDPASGIAAARAANATCPTIAIGARPTTPATTSGPLPSPLRTRWTIAICLN
jgi:transposase